MLKGRRLRPMRLRDLAAVTQLEKSLREAPAHRKGQGGDHYEFRQFLFGEESPGLGYKLLADIVGRLNAKIDAMKLRYDVILAPEPGGLVWGSLVAYTQRKTIVFGRLNEHWSRSAVIENKYSRKQISVNVAGGGKRLVIVDDVSSTGSTLATLMELAASSGFKVVGIVVVHARQGTESSLSRKLGVPVGVCAPAGKAR